MILFLFFYLDHKQWVRKDVNVTDRIVQMLKAKFHISIDHHMKHSIYKRFNCTGRATTCSFPQARTLYNTLLETRCLPKAPLFQ